MGSTASNMGCGGSNARDAKHPGRYSYVDGLNAQDGKKLTEVPEELIEYKASDPLEEVDFMRNQITILPDMFCSTHQDTLRVLNFSNNLLAEIPAALCYMRCLTTLKLSSNKIQIVPTHIGELKALVLLGMGANQIQELPDSIGHLPKLEQLLLNNNQIKELPDSICGLESLVSLLVLGNPELKALPEHIGKLEHLTNLNSSNCGLLAIPDSIGKCLKLIKLELNGNQLKDLPASCEALLGDGTRTQFKLRDNEELSTELLEKFEPSAAKIRRESAAKKEAQANAPEAAPATTPEKESLDEHGLPVMSP